MSGGARIAGGCRCGAVRFAAGPAIRASYCHCTDCRKATAAPVSVFVEIDPDTLRVDGDPAAYRTPNVTRSFCATCGTPLAYADERLEGRLWLMLGALDAPERVSPDVHAFAQEALPWLHITDDLPRESGFTVERPHAGNVPPSSEGF